MEAAKLSPEAISLGPKDAEGSREAWSLPGSLPDAPLRAEPPATRVEAWSAAKRSAASAEAEEGATARDAFRRLLGRLEEEHCRQLTELHQVIGRLCRDRGQPLDQDELLKSLPLPATSPQVRKKVSLAVPGDRDATVSPLPATPEERSRRGSADSAASAASMESRASQPPHRACGEDLLRVTILSARNLRRTDWVGSLSGGQFCDPYCICSIPGKPQVEFKTQVVPATLAPTWNHDAVVDEYNVGDSLEFVVKDADWFGDEFLGKATLHYADFCEDAFEGDLALQVDDAGKPGHEVNSTIRVRVEVQRKREIFSVRDVWTKRLADSRRTRTAPVDKRAVRLSVDEAMLRRTRTQNLGPAPEKRKSSSWMFDPSSGYRLAWDLLGITLVFIDLVWIPMQVFNPPYSLGLEVLGWIAVLYWTFDIALTFNTGSFKRGGFLIMNRGQIAFLYLRRWFLPDAALVIIEWCLMVQAAVQSEPQTMSDGAGAMRAGKFFKVARIIRLLRLVRIVKLRELTFMLQQLIDSEWMTITFMVSKNLMTILALNHLLACVWYWVGSRSDYGWVQNAGMKDVDFHVKYLMCLHWSMAQFTPGASPLHPVTVGERIYAVSVLALALVVATCFVSNITSTLSAVWAMRRHESTQALLLRKFLRQNNISRALASRVSRYIDCVLELRQNKVHPSRVQYLSYLSGPLNVELQSELQEPTLFMHEVFPRYKQASVCAFREVCTTALEQTHFAKNDMVFYRMAEAKYMYFLNMGALVYRVVDSKNDTRPTSKLEAGQSCSENALWMPWRHAGNMKALSDCDLTLLNVTKFCEVTSRDREAHRFARAYCRSFMERVQQVASFNMLSVTDLQLKVRVVGTEDEPDGPAPVQTEREDDHLVQAARDLKEAEDMEAELIAFSDSEDDCIKKPADSSSSSGLFSWSDFMGASPTNIFRARTPPSSSEKRRLRTK